jgi:Restriction alleviation protein Lar
MSEPTQAEVLKSCPFCGGKAYKTESVNGSNMVYVGCGPCGVHFKAQKDGTNGVLSKDVVAYWNTRAAERSLAPATPMEHSCGAHPGEKWTGDVMCGECQKDRERYCDKRLLEMMVGCNHLACVRLDDDGEWEVNIVADRMSLESEPAGPLKWRCSKCKHDHKEIKCCGVDGCKCSYQYTEPYNALPAAAPPATQTGDVRKAEQLAQQFHEAYERLAPSFGYETRKASAKPWAEVPENNRKLMIAVCAEILASAAPTPEPTGADEIVERCATAAQNSWSDVAERGTCEYASGVIRALKGKFMPAAQPEPTGADVAREVGNVLDHWGQLPNDIACDPGFEAMGKALKRLYKAQTQAAQPGQKGGE